MPHMELTLDVKRLVALTVLVLDNRGNLGGAHTSAKAGLLALVAVAVVVLMPSTAITTASAVA
jgi:hypothetical protein